MATLTEVYKKQVLLELGEWQVCKWGHETSGVHITCPNIPDTWSWLVTDIIPGEPELCFRCRTTVPPEIVALVKMLKWSTL